MVEETTGAQVEETAETPESQEEKNPFLISATKVVEGVTKEASVEFNYGADHKEMLALFGDKIVYDFAKRSIIIALQGGMRAMLERGESQNAITEFAKNWKPGQVSRVARPAKDVAADYFKSLSKEDQVAFIRGLGQK